MSAEVIFEEGSLQENFFKSLEVLRKSFEMAVNYKGIAKQLEKGRIAQVKEFALGEKGPELSAEEVASVSKNAHDVLLKVLNSKEYKKLNLEDDQKKDLEITKRVIELLADYPIVKKDLPDSNAELHTIRVPSRKQIAQYNDKTLKSKYKEVTEALTGVYGTFCHGPMHNGSICQIILPRVSLDNI